MVGIRCEKHFDGWDLLECNCTIRLFPLHSWECNGTYSIALLGNGTFYSISRDHNQPIKRSEFNVVLCIMMAVNIVNAFYIDCCQYSQ